MKKDTAKGQTIVIGSLLMFGLAVTLLVYAQVTIIPEINKDKELDRQTEAVNDMTELRSRAQISTATGTSQSFVFNSEISYIIQPAGPPNQHGQLSFIRGDLELRGAETVPSNNETPKVFDEINESDAGNIVVYSPSYVEISENRDIIMDNTIIYEETPSSSSRIRRTNQSIISGSQISIFSLEPVQDGKLVQKDLSMSIEPKRFVQDKITGASNGDIEILIRTTLTEQQWEDRLKNEQNVIEVQDVVGSGENVVQITLDGDVEYTINFIDARVRIN